MPDLVISKMFAWPRFKGLPARFQTATASFPEKRDQARHLLIFLWSKTLRKPAKPSIDSLHRLPCLFGDWGHGELLRSTSNPSPPSLARRTEVLFLPGCWSA